MSKPERKAGVGRDMPGTRDKLLEMAYGCPCDVHVIDYPGGKLRYVVRKGAVRDKVKGFRAHDVLSLTTHPNKAP